jgi:hypothetical protein
MNPMLNLASSRASNSLLESELVRRGLDRLGINPDSPVLDPCGITLQSPARPSGRNMAVAKIERSKMARAKYSTVGDTAQTQVSLFMRTGSFARENIITIANEQQIDGLQPHTDDCLMRQAVR